MMFTTKTLGVFGLTGVAGAIALIQACATPVGTHSEASAEPVPPVGYSVKWSTCTHFVEGDAKILDNSRIVIIAADGTVPIMRVEPLSDSADNVRRVAVAKLTNKVLLRGEGVLRDDRVPLGGDSGAVRPLATSKRTPEREAPQRSVSFLKLGQVVVTKERDGSILQWVVASEDLGEPVMNEATGKLEYHDTCFRNPKAVGQDTAGYIAPGSELQQSCLVEDMNQGYNAYSAYGYLPLMNYANMIVPTANDPETRPLPEIYATYVGFDGVSHRYAGLGAALNDINGAERDQWTVYYGYDIYCHVIVSDGLEVPGAKRPATRSLPTPGVVDGKTLNLWRPVNLNVMIANDALPWASVLEPEPVPVEEPIEVEPM